jgi:PKD repeat protein
MVPPTLTRTPRWAALLTALALLLGLQALGQPPASAAGADEVHYTLTGPTSVTFDWRSAADDLRYGLTSAYGTTVHGHQPSPLPFSSAGPFWEADLTGLSPATTYHYSIGGGPDATFSSAPTGNFRFDVLADIGDTGSYHNVGPMQANVAADDPDFVLAPGDLTYANNHGLQAVDQHFNDVMAWSRTAAYMPTWGNHEWDDSIDDLRNYKGRFALPNPQTSPGSPAISCCGEDWWWTDIAGVRFIAYPEPWSGAWTDWAAKADAVMSAAQADPSITFIITAGHRPAYSTGHHTGSSQLATIINNLGDKYPKYVLNFNGHSHDYERYQPIHGVTHITAGGGGASLEAPWEATDPRTAYRAMHLGHVRVDVTATSLHLEAVCGPPTADDDITCTNGAVIDSTTILAPGASGPGNRAPIVNAGPDRSVVQPAAASLAGAVTDDGLPNPPGAVAATWTKVSGPGTVTFADPAAAATTATFSAAGSYQLRLSATDSDLSSSDDVTVTVATASAGQILNRAVATGLDDVEERGSSMSMDSSDLELTVDGTTNQVVGMRFTNITVPRNAAITNAYVQFTVKETSTGAAPLTIAGQAADTAAAFTTTSKNVSSRARTQATVAWNPAEWPTLRAQGTDQRTPNIAPIVQEIVNRAGWDTGNAVAVVVTGSGRRCAYSFEGGAASAPVLHIEYTTGDPSPPTNQAPTANAGPDRDVTQPAAAALAGTISDDGLPNPPATLTAAWTKVSGPGTVTFANASAAATSATFSAAGTYTLRLAADDSVLTASDDVTVTVTNGNEAPEAQAGPDRAVTLPDSATLSGAVGDDGLPNPPGAVTVTWSKVSGPGTVTFADPSAASTTATFSAAGTYTLRLTADDSALSASDDVTVSVSAGNAAPTADAGPDRVVTLPGGAALVGAVGDDGLPNPPGAVTAAWSKVSGSGTVIFADPSAAATTATFSAAGTYTLRLTADDSALTASDDVTVTVSAANQAPTADAGPDRSVTLPAAATLSGAVGDDGLPNPPGAVTAAWTKVSGPGTVTFANQAAATTTATFSAAGTYQLRLSADDSALSASDDVTVTVSPGNQAPTANAGPDLAVTMPAAGTLSGSVSDDGLPNPPGTVTASWLKLTGPGQVTFANPAAASTTATFSAPGNYTLRLTADDSSLSSSDEVTVTVSGGITAQTLDRAVSTGNDDVEERGSSMSVDSSDLELTTDGGTLQIVGIRFANVTVPAGATVTNAYVQFTTKEVSTGPAPLTVWGQAADNAATFTTTSKNVSTRARVSTSVPWNPPDWPILKARGPDQRTPNLTGIVQQVVNRAGWASGNAMAIIVTGTGRRCAYSFEGGAASAPVLHIEYSF